MDRPTQQIVDKPTRQIVDKPTQQIVDRPTQQTMDTSPPTASFFIATISVSYPILRHARLNDRKGFRKNQHPPFYPDLAIFPRFEKQNMDILRVITTLHGLISGINS